MNHKMAGIVSVMAFVIIASVLACSPVNGDSIDDGMVLLDRGNGDTRWVDGGSGTIGEVLTGAVRTLGSDLSIDGTISVDGLTPFTTGSVTATWHVYVWDEGKWSDVTASIDMTDPYEGRSMAIGFHPEGIVPIETPDHRSSWTMFRGDSHNSGSQQASVPGDVGAVTWAHNYGELNLINSAVLYEGGRVYVTTGGGYLPNSPDPELFCYDGSTGERIWSFPYEKGAGYETATGVIAGDRIYVPASNGTVYAIPLEGPDGVISLDVPVADVHELNGVRYYTGPSSMVYDSGVLYFGTSNGFVYAVDLDLNVLWRTAIGGCVYHNTPTIHGGLLLIGAYDGSMYALDRTTGSIVDVEPVLVQEGEDGEIVYGAVNTPIIVGDRVFVSYSDGLGMNSVRGGIAIYGITDGGFTSGTLIDNGKVNNAVLPVTMDGFVGVYYVGPEGLCRMSADGTQEVLNTGVGACKAPITLVNGSYLYLSQNEMEGMIFVISMQGETLGSMTQPPEVAQYCMIPVTVVDGGFYLGTDCGVFGYAGTMVSATVGGGDSWSSVYIIVALVVLAAIALFLYRVKQGTDMPLGATLRQMFSSDAVGRSKVKRNKRRLAIVLIVGAVLGFVIFVVSLAVGPSGSYGFFETISLLCSAIGKTFTGAEMTQDEVFIFESRCSRVVAAFAVGVGLSISGSIYQAIIRNPMVDPYIMGVSAGAGVAAIATIAFNFTFFGLIDNITFVTPIVAMIGGVIAFGCTMVLAEKAGGSSLNYVLAGVIIGLVFSAIQTLMLSMSGDKLNDSMSWLFGTFANIDWMQALLILIPAMAMSIVPLFWAKEFNLVLLGEDQARQMGLDVRRFNRWMLVLASVLASVCVAFVGIIGFVGLVVPHFCRMLLGGDHRLVMPASIVVGGAMMMAADLFSKMVMIPMELPVGAITTVIGAPVFAYLLIKKGRMYDG